MYVVEINTIWNNQTLFHSAGHHVNSSEPSILNNRLQLQQQQQQQHQQQPPSSSVVQAALQSSAVSSTSPSSVASLMSMAAASASASSRNPVSSDLPTALHCGGHVDGRLYGRCSVGCHSNWVNITFDLCTQNYTVWDSGIHKEILLPVTGSHYTAH